MKDFDKSSIFTGVILLALASLFSVSLILQPLDFGIVGPGHNNFFFKLGQFLFSVYGFSSIFIPVFLLFSGLSCFAAKWSARRTMRMITALVPFFTCVITENLCRSVIEMGRSEFMVLKVAIIIITGLMLVIIEFLGSGILADKVILRQRRKNKKSDTAEDDLFTSDYDDSFGFPEEDESAQDVLEQLGKDEEPEKLNELKDKADSSASDLFGDTVPTEVFPLDENASEKTKATLEALEEKLKRELKAESILNRNAIATDTIVQEDSLITQEEFDALVDPKVPIEDSELEWPNLAPALTELPPEYSGDFDENSFDSKENVSDEENLSKTDTEKDDCDDNIVTTDKKESSDEEAIELEEIDDDKESAESDDFENVNFDDGLGDENTVSATDDVLSEKQENIIKSDDKAEENDYDLNFSIEDDFIEEENSCDDDDEFRSEDEMDSILSEDEFDDDFAMDSIEESESEYVNTEDNDVEKKTEDEDTETAVVTEESETKEETEDEYNFDDINLDFSDVFKVDDNKTDESLEEQPDNDSQVQDNVNYNNSFISNPKFPARITIHDGTENTDDDSENKKESEKKNQIAESKFPRKITLDPSFDDDSYDDETVVNVFQTKNVLDLTDDDSDEDNYEDDITLPLPEFDVEEPGNNSEDEMTEEDLSNLEYAQNLDDELTESNEITDMERVDDIVLEDELLDTPSAEEKEQPVKKSSIHFNGSKVFSEMEDDIRREQSEKGVLQNNNFADFPEMQNENEEALEERPVVPVTELRNPPSLNRSAKTGPYIIPSDLLIAYKDDKYWVVDESTKQDAANLKQTLAEFNIEADVIDIKKGPVVTMFEILPAPGVRLSKIVALQDNIALSLAAQSVRIVAPIPGKQAVGIEVPNKKRSVVGFRELIELDTPEWDKMAVPVILGKDILGKAQIIDLVKTPHMLIAGATGSGKSVCVNSLILSILFKRSYKDVKLMLIDPKVVELKLYNDIPHLLTPVITEPKKALRALQYCLCEMERRYALLDSMGVRDISNYNQKIKAQHICTEKLPYIVVIIDEFADLMATSGKELESIVARLTAMSRAVGIHLVLATQRPSVNVITGLIKANIPTRIAFMVASRTDSNIIIDAVGAEKLLGRGDMLYASAVDPAPIRIQGTFVSDQEVEDVVKAVKEYGEPDYLDESIFDDEEDEKGTDLFGEPVSDDDPLYDQALEIVIQAGKASASYIQRRLKIGYNRAARIVEEMEDRGIVGPANGSKPREIIHIP